MAPSAYGERDGEERPPARGGGARRRTAASGERYRPLPAGTHGLDPGQVRRDQSERLQRAMVELIAAKGYGAVRVADVAKLARVSPPTFYSLYDNKEDLLLSIYERIAEQTARTVTAAYGTRGNHRERLQAALGAFARLANEQPHAMSLQLLGAFGAGPKVLARRRRQLEELEGAIRAMRDGAGGEEGSREGAVGDSAVADGPGGVGSGDSAVGDGSGDGVVAGDAAGGQASGRDGAHGDAAAGELDLTVRFVLGGIREVSATRLQRGEQSQLSALAAPLAAWALSYPARMPAELAAPPARTRRRSRAAQSERARRAEGPLPRGRSELPREEIVKSQRERIVDATAAIVAERGLARLTVPAIARRAGVSLETFYAHYASKHEAFLGAQKVGLHQALLVTGSAYEAHAGDWPRAVAAGLQALLAYLSSEPAHAHLSLVDTFAASPEAIAIRDQALQAFAGYLAPGARRRGVPAIAPEAIAGGAWQVLHHYIERGAIAELPLLAPQLVALTLTPFLGQAEAVRTARAIPVG